jgi:TonB family protein
MKILVVIYLLAIATTHPGTHARAAVQPAERPATLAVLDLGDSSLGRLAAEKLAANLKSQSGLTVLDGDQARAAARGAGYTGSLNLSVSEARDLGAALGCDFFVLVDAQSQRRSPSSAPVYFDAYASIFVVSARTGKLVLWERPNFRGETAAMAEQRVLTQLASTDLVLRQKTFILRAQDDERRDRQLIAQTNVPVIEEAPDDDKAAEAEGLRLPRPFRRLMPAYPETAAEAEAEGIVDVLVDLDASGEVTRVDVARWAGFGLDQATVETVRKLHFFPAMRNGVAIPIRVLLRYNFRKPPR